MKRFTFKIRFNGTGRVHVLARTVQEARAILREDDGQATLDFDHDAGRGYKVTDWKPAKVQQWGPRKR